MIINLFEIFDPSSSYFSLNWMMSFLTVLILLIGVKYSKAELIFSLVYINIIKEINKNLSEKNFKGSANFIYSLFLFIFLLNIVSLLPYTYTITSQLIINLPIALCFWLISIIMGWKNNFFSSISHLVPLGTPIILCPFIVLIEIVSLLIRPITLSVRLTANIVAGHLLLLLLSSFIILNSRVFIISFIFLIILAFLEICVAFIQAYVFSTLVLLYSVEI